MPWFLHRAAVEHLNWEQPWSPYVRAILVEKDEREDGEFAAPPVQEASLAELGFTVRKG